jgi:large subunit ribosomal protein L7e
MLKGLVRTLHVMLTHTHRYVAARLKPLDAYVAYGYISHKSVTELLQRRAYTEFGGSRAILSDNRVVEKALGDKNILCIRDLVHEIYNIGENFESAVGMICTFRLSSPVGHFEKKILAINDKVEEKGGFLDGEGMEEFLNKIL